MVRRPVQLTVIHLLLFFYLILIIQRQSLIFIFFCSYFCLLQKRLILDVPGTFFFQDLLLLHFFKLLFLFIFFFNLQIQYYIIQQKGLNSHNDSMQLGAESSRKSRSLIVFFVGSLFPSLFLQFFYTFCY